MGGLPQRHAGAVLFISGSEDHIMPPAVQRSNAGHYKSKQTLTERKEFAGRSHFLPAQPGWEEVADYALSWATAQTGGLPAAST